MSVGGLFASSPVHKKNFNCQVKRKGKEKKKVLSNLPLDVLD